MGPDASTSSIRRSRHSVTKRPVPTQRHDQSHGTGIDEVTDSDDDLEIDLAKAALATGTAAFEKQQWTEAESLLQEALRALGQLPQSRRGFCDIFDLHFRLSVCTYYTQTPKIAEEALASLGQHSVTTDTHRARMCEATHLLAELYIRMNRVDLAKAECEKTLQTRRKLLGKRSDASLESMALMAHIYVLLNNRALAKTYLAMIPEEKREAILQGISASLGTSMAHLEFSAVMQPQPLEISSRLTKSSIDGQALSPVRSKLYRYRDETPSTTAHSPVLSRSSIATSSDGPHPRASPPDTEHEGHTTAQPSVSPVGNETTDLTAHGSRVSQPDNAARIAPPSTATTLSRTEILQRVGCQPRDDIEDAVCKGNHIILSKLLDKKKGFWRGNFRKHVRPERVTALHFAALFGELDMARRLIATNYNVNEVPFGYSTALTPLHFAIGGRQVGMVQFLLASGAQPIEPDTWSTLASQAMLRSWLIKTMSDANKESAAERIVAILDLLLSAGWQINTPFGASGGTVLHQAVALWTGSYRFDLELRAAITLFICTRGGNPFHKNNEGKTPWDIAVAEDHQDLLGILRQGVNAKAGGKGNFQPVELPASL